MGARPRKPTLAGVLGAAVLLWGLAIGLRRLNDNSFLTHLATGRLILDGGIPRTDPFSFTAPGTRWTVQSWLADIVYAVAERLAGGNGIQLLQALTTMGLAGLTWRATRPARTLISRVLVAAGALVIGTSFWGERPLVFGLLLLAGVVLLAETDKPSPWLLLPVMWLWVNVHGSFPFGVAYLVVRLAGRHLDGQPTDRLRRLLAFAAAGTALGALNPLGPRLLLFPLTVLTRRQAFTEILEWRSPDFAEPVHLVYLAMAIASLALLVRHPRWEDALPAAAFAALGMMAQRNVPVAAAILVPVLARGLRDMGSLTGEARRPAAGAAIAAIAAIGIVVAASALAGPAYNLSAYPVAELDWMEERGLLARRVATQDFVGNLLTLRRDPPVKVFIDDRYDMYPDRVRDAYLRLYAGREGWQRHLDDDAVEVVVWERDKPLAALLQVDPAWRVVHLTRRWVVAQRASLPVP